MSAFSVDPSRQTTPPFVDGVVHNRLVQFALLGDQTLAQLINVLDYAVVHTLHALFCTFFAVSAVQKLFKSVKIRQSCSQMYTATFYEPRQKCRY